MLVLSELEIYFWNTLQCFLHVIFDSFHELFFRHPNGLSCDSILVRDGLQGQGLFGNQSLLEDNSISLTEAFRELGKPRFNEALQFSGCQLFVD